MKIAGPIRPRFEAKFRVTPGCWPWLGAKHGKGYGHFKIPTGKGDGKVEKAQRVSYSLYIGEIPHGMMVLHRCDNPGCVNPDHLFLGTNADNMADMKAKGRGNGPRGAACHFTKLADEQVITIRSDSRKGVEIAKHYGVSAALVSDIRNRKCWKHI